MAWLNQKEIFLESNSLGVFKTITIGYILRVHPQYTNCQKLKALLTTALEDIHIAPTLAIELSPMLQEAQTDAMANGDLFSPPLPQFEVYKTQISHG